MKATHYVNPFLVSFVLLSVSALHALDSQGNLAVAGFVNTDLNDLRNTLFSVVQYNPSGQINTTFGNGGLATLGFRHGIAMDVAIDPTNDSIIVVGTAIDPTVNLPRAIISKFIGTGMNAGLLDPAFGLNGFSWLAPAPSTANGINFQPAEYQICGSYILHGRYHGFFYTLDSIDGSLLNSSTTISDIKLNAHSREICAGKSIINGVARPIVIAPFEDPTPTFVADISGEFLDISVTNDVYAVGIHANKGLLVKLLNKDDIDTSFGSNGYVIADFGNKKTTFNAVKIDFPSNPDRIFICGTAQSLQSHIFVAEYDTSGNLVPSFGNNGVMTIFDGPNIQTIARDLVLPESFGAGVLSSCPTGSSTGMFAVGAANGRTPLIANLNCSNGSLKTAYGDKAIAGLETEALTSMTVLKETEPSGTSLPNPASSPFARTFNSLAGNPFAVSLTGSGNDAGFVLQPGRYYLDAQAAIQDVSAHQLALYNDLLDINESFGDSIWNSSGILTKALLKGQLFVSEPTKYILRHYFAGSGPNFAIGQAANLSGLAEVYTQMNIQQL